MRRSVYVEVVIGVVVLALTAVLVGQPRGKESLAAGYRDPVTASAPLAAGKHVTITAANEPRVTAVAPRAASNTGPVVLSIVALVLAAGALALALLGRRRRVSA